MLAKLKLKANEAVVLANEKAIKAKASAMDLSKRSNEMLFPANSEEQVVLQIDEPSDAKVNSNTAVKEESSFLKELGCSLTKKQRIYGALSCYVMGGLFSFMSSLMLFGAARHIRQFALLYTLGNMCSIGSSLFLVGPVRQVKVMCMPVRRVAAMIWICTMFLTLVVAFTLKKAGPIVLLLLIIQYVAMLWYGASFVPYGRAIIRKCCNRAVVQVSSA